MPTRAMKCRPGIGFHILPVLPGFPPRALMTRERYNDPSAPQATSMSNEAPPQTDEPC